MYSKYIHVIIFSHTVTGLQLTSWPSSKLLWVASTWSYYSNLYLFTHSHSESLPVTESNSKFIRYYVMHSSSQALRLIQHETLFWLCNCVVNIQFFWIFHANLKLIMRTLRRLRVLVSTYKSTNRYLAFITNISCLSIKSTRFSLSPSLQDNVQIYIALSWNLRFRVFIFKLSSTWSYTILSFNHIVPITFLPPAF